MKAPLALCAALVASACAGHRPAGDGCTKDTDCKGSRICVQHSCLEPSGAQVGSDGEPVVVNDAGQVVHGPGSPAYAMFGGDARHSGRRAGPAPTKKPTEQWTFAAAGPIVGSPTVGPDGTIYVSSHDRFLYALGADGALRWKVETGDRMWSTPAVAEDGTVYAGSDDDHLYAIDGATGDVKWKLRIGDCDPKGFGPESSRCDADGGPTIGGDGTIYLGGDGVHAVWPDGALRWKFTTAEHVSGAPAIADDGTIIATSQDDAVYALAPDGTKRWELRTRGDVDTAAAIGPDGRIYVGSDDDAIYAIEPDGTVAWKLVTAADVRSTPAFGADGTIYAGSYDGNLYAMKPSGQVEWKLATADKIHGSPGVATNGVILVGSQDDHLYAIDAEGVVLWYLDTGGDVDATPAVSADGTLYLAGDDGVVRAFR